MNDRISPENCFYSLQLNKHSNIIQHAFFTKHVSLEQTNEYFSTSKHISHTNQVHGNHIHVITDLEHINPLIEADAQVTNLTDVPLIVKTADCGGILLVEPVSKIVASIHAGWRSVSKDIINLVITKIEDLGGKRSNIIAALGPMIQQKSYEVGPEVKEIFINLHEEYVNFFINKPNNKSLFNLAGVITHQLKHFDVKIIDDLKLDTYSNEKVLNSYRRDCHKNITIKRNQLSGIMLIKK